MAWPDLHNWLPGMIAKPAAATAGFALSGRPPPRRRLTQQLDPCQQSCNDRLKSAPLGVQHNNGHIISDKGCQFWSASAGKPTAVYSAWLEQHGVKPRFGAVGQHGSIAVIERFWRTMKESGLRVPAPLRFWRFTEELEIVRHWYNSRRPHSSLAARTPDEVAAGVPAPRQRARLEVRPRYPVPREDIEQGNVWRVEAVHLKVSAFQGRRHLPDVQLDFDKAA